MRGLNAAMFGIYTVVLLSVSLGSALAQCSLNEIDCCLTEFSSIIKPSGISLSEERVAAVCTFKDETLECLDLFIDQCIRNETDRNDVEDLVNRTKAYIGQICPPTSDFMTKLKDKEACILNATEAFQTCYKRTVQPEESEDSMKNECCEYKDLRNCAVQTVENNCGPIASQLVHEEMVHMNGAVLEWSCSDIFSQCQSSTAVLVSSIFLKMCSIFILKFL